MARTFALPPHSVWRRFLLYSIPSLIFCLGGSLWLSHYERQKFFDAIQHSERELLLSGIELDMDSVSAELLNIQGDLEILVTGEEFQAVLDQPTQDNTQALFNEWLAFSRIRMVYDRISWIRVRRS